MITSSLFLFALSLSTQDTPVAIPKSELPAKAECVVCSSGGESHGEEKPAAGLRYKSQSYFFCNVKEVDVFKRSPEAFIPPVLPRPAHKITATLLSGEAITLESYKGKVVLLDFWATWCTPCIVSMPHLRELQKKYADKGFTVLGMSIDEDTKKVAPFVAKRKLNYPIALDSKTAPSWGAYSVSGIPAIFLIDRNGQIINQWRGKADPKAIDAAVEAALKSE